MTHNDIYKKFLIEYDKADITSSYPSLTKYEQATILDKAYLALIAQKVTGMNTRRASFEQDVKAVEDVRPLITRERKLISAAVNTAQNEFVSQLPSDFLYFVEGSVEMEKRGNKILSQPSVLLSHNAAQTYKSSTTNLPWIKNPVMYLEDDWIHILIDNYKYPSFPEFSQNESAYCLIIYIKKPESFVEHYNDGTDPVFELSDSMAEELINLAIIMSTEIVESTRLQGKINTSALES